MKEKIGFIAVGQAGGNIGSRLELKGYKVLYINTSQEDLSTLNNAKFKHHIKDGEGCNKDRLKAKQALIDDFDAISRKIQEGFDCEFIYVIFSSGGGTGSGAGPMLCELMLNDIDDGNLKQENVGIITILPGTNEPIKTKINSYECFDEISKVDGLSSVIILDNDKCMDKLVLNNKFTTNLTEFLDIPIKHKSERGNIDKAEILETLKAPGMLKIIQIPSKDSKTDIVLNSINNIYAESENDGIVKYISLSQAGTQLDLNLLQRDIGVPVDIFQTYNEHSTILALAGLSYPASRFKKIEESINENKEKVIHSLHANTKIELNNDIDFLKINEKKTRKRNKLISEQSGEEKKMSRRDIMAKYLS